MYKNLIRSYFGTSSFALCIEVYITVSLVGRVHYQRFHTSMLVQYYNI